MLENTQMLVREMESTVLNRLGPIFYEHATECERLASEEKRMQIQYQRKFIAAVRDQDAELAALYEPSMKFHKKYMLRHTESALNFRMLASFMEETVTIRDMWSCISDVVEAVNTAISSENITTIRALLRDLRTAAEEQSINITNQCQGDGNDEGDGGHLNEQ